MIPKQALQLIKYIDKTKLSKASKNFVKSVEKRAKVGRYLSPDQSRVLQEIYRESQGGNDRQLRERIA